MQSSRSIAFVGLLSLMVMGCSSPTTATSTNTAVIPAASLGKRLDGLKGADSDLHKKMAPIFSRADNIITKPIFRRVHNLEDFAKLDGVWGREQTAHKRTDMMKDKKNARYFGLASNDLTIMRELIFELPLLAAAYRISEDKKYLEYIEKQLSEFVTWNPLQRPGWTLRVGSAPLKKGGDGVWLATGTGIQTLIMTIDIPGKEALSPLLQKNIDELLKREVTILFTKIKKDPPGKSRLKKFIQSRGLDPTLD